MSQKAGDPVLANKDFLPVYAYQPIEFNLGRVLGTHKPTVVDRGIFSGWSLPIFNSDDEDLWGCICVPDDWSEDTDFDIFIGGWLDTANTGKKFQIRVEYSHWTAGDTVPNTSSNIDIESETGTAAQYKSFKLQHTVPYSGIIAGDVLGFRIYRIAATSDEIAGEFVLQGTMLRYQRIRIGGYIT